MTQPIENPATKATEPHTASEAAAEKKMEHVADEAAAKAAKTEQRYDSDHGIVSI